MSANKKIKTPFLVTYTGKYALWRFINIIIMGALIGGALLTYVFIYQNIYNTISNTYAITELNANINWTALNSQDYTKAQDILKQKAEIKQISRTIRNIFSYAGSSIPTSSTSTISQ